jgi:AcrR family transcriptional regulator
LAAASTRAIAREAGCADGTLYNHFADRADLFVTIFLDKLLPDYWDDLFVLELVRSLMAGVSPRSIDGEISI